MFSSILTDVLWPALPPMTLEDESWILLSVLRNFLLAILLDSDNNDLCHVDDGIDDGFALREYFIDTDDVKGMVMGTATAAMLLAVIEMSEGSKSDLVHHNRSRRVEKFADSGIFIIIVVQALLREGLR